LQDKAAGAGSAGAGVTDGIEESARQFGDSIWPQPRAETALDDLL